MENEILISCMIPASERRVQTAEVFVECFKNRVGFEKDFIWKDGENGKKVRYARYRITDRKGFNKVEKQVKEMATQILSQNALKATHIQSDRNHNKKNASTMIRDIAQFNMGLLKGKALYNAIRNIFIVDFGVAFKEENDGYYNKEVYMHKANIMNYIKKAEAAGDKKLVERLKIEYTKVEFR